MNELKVYCKQAKLLNAPSKQTFTAEVPAMTAFAPTN